MRKTPKQSGYGIRRRPKDCWLQVVVVIQPADEPYHVKAMPEDSPFTEICQTIYLWILKAWGQCQEQPSLEGRRPVGLLYLELVFAKKPRRQPSDQWRMLEAEITDRVLPVFLGANYQPRPIDLPFVQGKLTYQSLPGLDSPAATSDASTIANLYETGHDNRERGIATPPQEGSLSSPEETIKKLVAELIRTLSTDPVEKAEALIALEHTFSQTIHTALQSEAEPLIKSLLENIPADYEGKRHRAALINRLLTALDRGILIHDQQGRPHVCSLQATHARPTDETGNLRLRARTTTSGSQRTFPLPSLDQFRIIETSPPEQAKHSDQVRGQRTI